MSDLRENPSSAQLRSHVTGDPSIPWHRVLADFQCRPHVWDTGCQLVSVEYEHSSWLDVQVGETRGAKATQSATRVAQTLQRGVSRLKRWFLGVWVARHLVLSVQQLEAGAVVHCCGA